VSRVSCVVRACICWPVCVLCDSRAVMVVCQSWSYCSLFRALVPPRIWRWKGDKSNCAVLLEL